VKLRVSRVAAVLAGAALVAMGAFAFRWRVDTDVADGYNARLRRLLELNHRLSGEVMRVRSGMVAHYDGLAQSASAIHLLHADLGEPPDFLLDRQKAEVKERLAESRRAFEETALSLERFKSEYAVLKNSLRFLPVAARRLDDEVTQPRPAPGVEASRLMEGMVRDLLLLQVWRDERAVERVTRSLAALTVPGAAADSLSPDVAVMAEHARVVRDHSPTVDALTRAVALGPGAAHAERLMTTYGRHYQAALDRASLHRSVLFVLALVTLGAVSAYVILRIRRSAEELARTSRSLTDALSSLRVEQEKQRELNDLKSRFVAMTSHEFRTPLSVMLSSAEMLSVYGEQWSRERKEDHLGRIRAGALAMTGMLDSILLIGRSDAGMLELRPAPLDLGQFCQSVVEGTGQSTGQAHRIVHEAPANDVKVVADEVLLRHILENLLSNALKYSPEDKPVHLEVGCDERGVSIEVRDEGIGISEEDQRRLFETFHRGRNVGRVPGTGLGLSIVKRAVDRHGGTVEIESRVGQGTRCQVRIPCERVPLERRAS
jgi:signal transduction histidine kinase